MNVHSVSLKGLRDQNEDKHEIILNLDGKDQSKNNVNYFAIFDGHGGKEVSKYVQENISKYFMDKRLRYPISKSRVCEIYDHIQKELRNFNFAYHSGTTGLIVIHFKHNNMHYINVLNNGDCRSVLCRDNFGIPLTKDCKPSWPEEKTRIEALGGIIKFDGYDWRIKDLSVSRAFGDFDATPFITHRPNVYRYKLDKSDKFLVLACDGLWDVMSNQDVVNFILHNCYDKTTNNRINKGENMAKKLAQFAIKKGSTDNVSVIIVFFR